MEGSLLRKIAGLRRALYLAGKEGKEAEDGMTILMQVYYTITPIQYHPQKIYHNFCLSAGCVCVHRVRERVPVLQRVFSHDTCPESPDWRRWYLVTRYGVRLAAAVEREHSPSQDSASFVSSYVAVYNGYFYF